MRPLMTQKHGLENHTDSDYKKLWNYGIAFCGSETIDCVTNTYIHTWEQVIDIVWWPKGNPTLTSNGLLDIGKIWFASDPSWQELDPNYYFLFISGTLPSGRCHKKVNFNEKYSFFLGQTCSPYCVSLSRL